MQNPHSHPIRSMTDLLGMSSPDPAQHERRIRLLERDLGLVIKAIVLVILFYFFYWSNWVADYSSNPTVPPDRATWSFGQHVLQYAFLVYLAFNIGTAFVLLGMAQVSFPMVQWAVFTIALVDGLFLGGLITMTGGLGSSLYWLYLLLVIRNCLSINATFPQIVLNLSMMVFYAGAVLMDMTITKMDELPMSEEGLPQIIAWADVRPFATPLLFRLGLLGIVAAWCHGLHALVERQRRRVEEQNELALRREQLEAAGRLAAEIAHQLKNPLAIINNASYTLQKTVREGKTITQQIQIIREEVERSDRLITELMGYVKLNEGHVEKLDVQEELERALVQAFPPAVKYDVQVHRDYAPGLPYLLANRSHLSEVFVNLLQNAREAMNGRGNIWIGTAYGPNYSVLITIADDGPGIAPEHQAKVFEAYFTTRERGTGLGLAIVKHNTEMYGGKVTLESELGKGTRFILNFPARTLMTLRK